MLAEMPQGPCHAHHVSSFLKELMNWREKEGSIRAVEYIYLVGGVLAAPSKVRNSETGRWAWR